MYISAIIMAVAPFLLAVKADGAVDAKEIPQACAAICKPINALVSACEVNKDAVGGQQNEQALETQCICTNKSFDVATVLPKCADCLGQQVDKPRKGDEVYKAEDFKDINALVTRCGFSASTYTTSDGDAAKSIKASAVPIKDISKLNSSRSGSGSSGSSPASSPAPKGTTSGSHGATPTKRSGSRSSPTHTHGTGSSKATAKSTSSPKPSAGAASDNTVPFVGAVAAAAAWAFSML